MTRKIAAAILTLVAVSGWILAGVEYGSRLPARIPTASAPTLAPIPGFTTDTWTFTRTGAWMPETRDCDPIPQSLGVPPADSKGCAVGADYFKWYWTCGTWRVELLDIHSRAGFARFEATTTYLGTSGDTCRVVYVGTAEVARD